jgi:carbon-monoxide dehydrogenase large subunit
MRIGQSVSRPEDPTLLRGEGRYTDDVNEPGQAYAYFVRSPHAHGVLKGIDVQKAKPMPGVLAVYTGKDLAAYGTHKCIVPLPGLKKPERRSLPTDKVRFVGDPVACVVAQTAVQAKDAAEAVELDIEPLPAVALASAAAKPDAPQLYDDVPGNVAVDYHYGDAQAVAAAFARAAHVTRLKIRNTRVVVAAMEPRAALCSYDAGRWTLTAPGQGVIRMKAQLAEILGVPEDKVRLRTHQVGGSFGMKGWIYPEYVCLAHAARALGRPVKWTDERSGSFVSDQQGRDGEVTGELALDQDGHFLALRLTGYGNVGAFLAPVGPNPPTLNAVKNGPSVYRTPLIEVRCQVMFTNTSPVGPYRGAGRPEANYYVERLVDAAAAEMGLDRLELRRRNHVRPQDMPYKAPSEQLYDSGEFGAVLDKALEAADLQGFAQRKAQSKARGLLRGLGVGSFLEGTAPPGKELAALRFEGEEVTVLTGTLDQGQGHRAAFAQVLATRLGLPFERIHLVQGDSDQVSFGGGTGGSRSLMMSGAAIAQAADLVIKKGRELAGEHLETAPQDIEFRDGRFSVAGTDRGIGLLELSKKNSGKLDVAHITEVIATTYPNGCHVCEVEIDPETGRVAIARYSSVNDFGHLVNPLLVEGQVHGGVVQGLGQALMEEARYDDTGQLLTGSFMDYALPRAGDLPAAIGFASHPVPATTNPLGVKGCGEAGCAGALTSVMNAIVDALGELGIRHFDMPASPQRVWAAIQQAKS